ncbi:hypothetical protein H7H37_12640, partial [Mycolicibacterium insubricum]|nr:hypothetical protein [Mycolicibacterium insubricum]
HRHAGQRERQEPVGDVDDVGPGLALAAGLGAGASDFPQRAWLAIAGGEDPNRSGSGGSSAAVRTASARVTSSKAAVTSAQASLDAAEKNVADLKAKGASADKVAVAEKKRDAAAQRLTAAQERQGIAEDKLADAKEKAAKGSDKQAKGGDGGAESFGQSLVSGMLQGLGLDGSVFSNPFDWPNVKSAMALANFGGGLVKNAMSGDTSTTSTTTGGGGMGGGALGGIGLPNITDLIKPMDTRNTRTPIDHPGSGAEPGPTTNVTTNYNIQAAPQNQLPNATARQYAAARRNGMA